jgi:hypothetical protein
MIRLSADHDGRMSFGTLNVILLEDDALVSREVQVSVVLMIL